MPDTALRMEEVFKTSGVPTHTFVEPRDYANLKIAIRTPGRGVIIEGPSGIGKTTAVSRAIEDLKLSGQVTKLLARRSADLEAIRSLPSKTALGIVIVDDFHRLPEDVRQSLGEFLKVLADEERTDSKLIIVGINKTGESLVRVAHDINTRIDVMTFEANARESVVRLIEKGEQALHITINTKDEIAEAANGSFFLAQYLCHATCAEADVTEGQDEVRQIEVSFEAVRERALGLLDREFREPTVQFASGTRLKKEGRAPYLHVLKWLAEANEWTLQLHRELARRTDLKGSVGQIVDKGYLEDLINKNDSIARVLHYNPQTQILSVDDPRYVFYIRNLSWQQLADDIGFVNVNFDTKYDFALSFAGADRVVAEELFELLAEEEFSVFYDRNEQHRMLAKDIEEYLAPIYRSEARYVIALLGSDYPKRIWTQFESKQFRSRFGEEGVIPVWFKNVSVGTFDESTRVGGFEIDPSRPLREQLQSLVQLLQRKIREETGDEIQESLFAD